MEIRTRQKEFEQLLEPHLASLFRIAYRFTGHTEDAEDLIQNLLLKLYPRLDELRELDSLHPWLVRVLYREFVDSYRKRSRLRRWLLPAEELGEEEVVRAEYDAGDEGPEQQLERFRSLERVARALKALSADHRALVALHDIEGYTMDEIAGMLGLARGTVKSRLHRARARLRACLEREPFSSGGRVTGREVTK